MKKIADFPEYLHSINQSYCEEVPSVARAQAFVDHMVEFLFPVKTNKHVSKYEIERRFEELKCEFRQLLIPLKKDLKRSTDETTDLFFSSLNEVFQKLLEDAECFVQFDPAAYSVEEVILSYPGFYAITVYRLSHELYNLEIPVLPRVMSEYAHSNSGVDIHPGAEIGREFFIDHGTGTVIGETTVIGNRVKIYQGVTLGALFVEKKLAKKKRHPTIEDNVIIYARSTILGGETVIGRDTVVGGNVWLTDSVPPNSVVYQKNKTVVREGNDSEEPVNWVI